MIKIDCFSKFVIFVKHISFVYEIPGLLANVHKQAHSYHWAADTRTYGIHPTVSEAPLSQSLKLNSDVFDTTERNFFQTS